MADFIGITHGVAPVYSGNKKNVFEEVFMEISGALDKIIHYWDNYASQFDEAHATEDLTKWKEALKDLLGPETERVLDLGTGTGFLAK
jgi:cyclopropane fatty-acyl-phospholipid synthase-like methyltransferase